MNYRHDFHAGNFADVMKHAVLARILLYLGRKPAPFRVIDTHAGSGRYDLAGIEAARTGEWRDGIGRIDPAAMASDARALLEPYWALAGAAARGAPYPGSPALALALTRPLDRMIFCETHPDARAALERTVGRDKRAKVMALDGYQGLKALIPPAERRGLVVIDPPFEAPDEAERLAAAVAAAARKWSDGVMLVWLPIKDRRAIERTGAALIAAGVSDLLRLELGAAPRAEAPGRLAAAGLLVVNPPWTLAAEAACLLPELARQLGGGAATSRVERLAGEASPP